MYVCVSVFILNNLSVFKLLILECYFEIINRVCTKPTLIYLFLAINDFLIKRLLPEDLLFRYDVSFGPHLAHWHACSLA